MATTGSITLNGISDKELAKIWELKAKHEGKFNFQPNAMQPVYLNNNPQQPTGKYNNVTFTWQEDAGLKVVHEVIEYILKKDEQAIAA
jgi:hypothetical protein